MRKAVFVGLMACAHQEKGVDVPESSVAYSEKTLERYSQFLVENNLLTASLFKDYTTLYGLCFGDAVSLFSDNEKPFSLQYVPLKSVDLSPVGIFYKRLVHHLNGQYSTAYAFSDGNLNGLADIYYLYSDLQLHPLLIHDIPLREFALGYEPDLESSLSFQKLYVDDIHKALQRDFSFHCMP